MKQQNVLSIENLIGQIRQDMLMKKYDCTINILRVFTNI